MTELPEQPTFRDRIGGRWAISWQAFVITVPFAVAALVVSSTRSWQEGALWIVVGLIGAIVAGIWILLMHRTVFRDRASQPVSLAWALAHPAITVTFGIVGTVLASVALGLPQESGPSSRVVPTLVIGTLWSVVITLMLEARWRFGRERELLIERAVQQQLAAMQEAEVADSIRASLQTEITHQLARTRAGIDERLASIEHDASKATAAASDLRRAAAQTVRPLSHELAQRTERTYPRPGIIAVLRNIVERQPFRPLPVSLIYLISTGAREFESSGWLGGLIAICVTVALIWLTMSVANAAMQRWPHRHAALFIAGIALIEFPSVALQPVRSQLTGVPTDWPGTAISIGFGIVIILITSGFGSLRATRADLLRTFATDVKEEEVATIARSRALAGVARDVAGLLHGPIQTKLVACAMVIDQAAITGDVEKVNEALHQARTVLEQPMPVPNENLNETLADVVERKAALWSGLAQITVTIDAGIAHMTGPVITDIATVVEEGIANAIQHGSASEITVAIDQPDDRLDIRIRDNGTGPSNGTPGLGSRILGQLDPGWRLDAELEGACLHVSLTPVSLNPARGKPPVPSSPTWA